LGHNLADVEVRLVTSSQLKTCRFFGRGVEAEGVASVSCGHRPVGPEVGRQVDGLLLVGRTPVVDVQRVAEFALVSARRPENASKSFHV